MGWESHDVNFEESYIVLCKHGEPLYVAEGPFPGSNTEAADKRCKALNRGQQGACKYHVATRSRYISLEVNFDDADS